MINDYIDLFRHHPVSPQHKNMLFHIDTIRMFVKCIKLAVVYVNDQLLNFQNFCNNLNNILGVSNVKSIARQVILMAGVLQIRVYTCDSALRYFIGTHFANIVQTCFWFYRKYILCIVKMPQKTFAFHQVCVVVRLNAGITFNYSPLQKYWNGKANKIVFCALKTFGV